MGFWKENGRRTLHFGRRSRFESELTDEIRFHIDTRVEELEKSGWTRSDALHQAHREFGSHARVREDSRAAWHFNWLEDLVADLKHAARSYRRSAAFSLTAIVCLALGIGANTLIFSLVNAILLKSLPFPEADRLVMLRFSPPQQPDQKLGMNSGSYFFIREHTKSFERMGAVRLSPYSIAAEGSESRERLTGAWITPGLAETMGVNPMIGRWFSQEDTSPGIVISHGLWQRAFGGSPDVLGKKLQMDFLLATVVGVMPPGYQTLSPDIDLWGFQSDQQLANALSSPNRLFNIIARLKPGVTVAQAQADLDSIAGPLGEELEMNRGWALNADTLAQRFFGGENPIGKQIQSSHLFDLPREIVGVVGDVRQDRYQLAPSPQMYVPRSQLPAKMDMSVSFEVLVATFIVRTNSSPGVLTPTFRQVVAEVDRSLAVTNVLTIEQYAAAQLQDLRHYAMLLGIFGGISVLLSFVGLFGVMANNVSQRRNEIGIRVALGATSSTILSLVAKQGLVLIGIGMAFGLIASLALTRALARFLWGVTATDPLTFFIVMAAFAAVALIACYLPARRALRMDPMAALRPE